jgi:hypothetical protein
VKAIRSSRLLMFCGFVVRLERYSFILNFMSVCRIMDLASMGRASQLLAPDILTFRTMAAPAHSRSVRTALKASTLHAGRFCSSERVSGMPIRMPSNRMLENEVLKSVTNFCFVEGSK